MAIWLTKRGKQKRGPSGAKRKDQRWRIVRADGSKSDWSKGNPYTERKAA